MTANLDIGPLSWVKGEIDLALERARAEMTAYAVDPAGGPLQKARASLHQAHGALAVVGLEGVTEFSQAIEQLLAALADASVPDASAATHAVQEGFVALRAYLDDLMAGGAHQSLKLFPIYRTLVLARGLPEPSPGELFFPDLTQRPPKREREPEPLAAAALAARLRAARLGFERGLLKWIKGDAKGISEMKASLTMIEMTRTTPAARAYWWVALGVLDALGADGLPDAGEARRFLLRLAAQIKKLGEGLSEVPAALLREALYLAATAGKGHAALAVVRAAYRLDSLLPAAVPADVDRQDAHVRRLRELVAAAKDEWNRLSAGTVAALPPFHEHVTWMAEAAAATHAAAYVQLTAAIREQADLLRRDPTRHTDALALEIATALLLAESALDDFAALGADFAQQVNVVLARLAAIARGEQPGALELPHLDAMSHRAQERLLLESVMREIRTDLGTIEQTLDAFFRDATRQPTLAALQHPVRQIEGALARLGEARAVGVFAECAAAIGRFSQPGFAPQPGDFEDVAKKLSALGFFLTRLEHGSADPEDFFEPPTAEAAQPASAADDALDAELLGIFLEEAREVLATVTAHLPRAHAAPEDKENLVVLRRGFHTLKGSGRMVGLNDLGEAAWAVEQVMNRWLDEARAATPALLEMLDLAVTVFRAWIAQLEAEGGGQHDVTELMRRCAALRGVSPAPTFAEETGAAESAGTQAPSLPPAPAPVSAEVLAFPEPLPVRVGDIEVAPALYNLYLDETRGYVATLQAHLGQEAVPGDELIRAAHTLASISAATGFLPVRHLAHALEAALIRFAQMEAVPSEAQRFVFARCAGALEGMLGAVAERRMPGEEGALAATLNAMTPAQVAADIPLSAVDRRALRIEDEIDPQLLPLFLDEGTDLMREIGEHLRAWRAAPDDDLNPLADEIPHALARALHTLKGSARMAGAMVCGELLHAMEARIEEAVAEKTAPQETIDALEVSLDRAANLMEDLRNGMPAEQAPVQPLVSAAAAGMAVATDELPLPAAVPVAPASAVAHPVLRVRADLVDQWVNEAGEIAIARTRIEGEMRELKSALLELTESVLRLRSQLREVEIQAESQMQSQQALAADNAQLFDPLEFDRFTRFQEVTRMMAESVNDVATVQHNLLLNLGHASAALAAQARLNRDLSQRLMGARMVPFDSLAERLHRVVRQAAKDAGKRVNLDIRNGQTEMDRSVLEKMAGPIEHLLRNSAAHGIEDAAPRGSAGKPVIGQITLSLAQEGNEIVITIADDGAGLDFARIRQRAIEQGLLPPAAAVDEATLTQFIFHAGFSTAAEVTALSGRGVGMGVVKSETTALGGRIDVLTTAGQGVTFRLTLPLTLAVTQAVLVQLGDRRYAIPSSMVEQANELKAEAIAAIRQAGGAEWQGAHYPWHYLPQLLGDSHAVPPAAHRIWLLQVKSGTGRVALEVDGLAGNQEIVVKPMGPQLARVPGLIGATVLADGEVVLLVNPVALLARAGEPKIGVAGAPPAERAAEPPTAATVMVVDDSLTVRKIISRLLARQGYRVLVAKDGVDALEQLREELPDVMLVDIEMPRMDGFGLTRAIRADARLAAIPVIAITSRTADKHRQHAMEAGVNHYLGKPYNEDELLVCIAGLITKETR